MKVTPVSGRFGKHKQGDEFELPDRAAKVFIKAGKLQKVEAGNNYQTRMMTASDPMAAPYGYKADGTPRKRPGRPATSE